MLSKLLNRALGKRLDVKSYPMFHTVVVMGHHEKMMETGALVEQLIKVGNGKRVTGLKYHIFNRDDWTNVPTNGLGISDVIPETRLSNDQREIDNRLNDINEPRVLVLYNASSENIHEHTSMVLRKLKSLNKETMLVTYSEGRDGIREKLKIWE